MALHRQAPDPCRVQPVPWANHQFGRLTETRLKDSLSPPIEGSVRTLLSTMGFWCDMGPITVSCRNFRANVHIADPTRGGGRYVCGKCQEAVELPEPYGLNSDASTLSDYVGGGLKYPDIDGDAGDGQQGSVN